MNQVNLRCRCGAVQGTVDLEGAQGGLCYCDDCRAFAHELGRGDTLDAAGGSAVIQIRPGNLQLTQGHAHIGCLRLSDRGMFRFFTTCCQTPLANVMSKPRLPFIGLARAALHGEAAQFPPLMGIQGRFATAAPPPGTANTVSAGQALSTLLFLASSAWNSRGKRNPLFDESDAPIAPVRVLTDAEREALRARDRTA